MYRASSFRMEIWFLVIRNRSFAGLEEFLGDQNHKIRLFLGLRLAANKVNFAVLVNAVVELPEL